MGRLTLDPNNPPALEGAASARLALMTDTAITAAAEADADNPPLSDAALVRVRLARRVQAVRAHTGLSQRRFAAAYRINVGRLRDLE